MVPRVLSTLVLDNAAAHDCLCSGLEGREGGKNGACDTDRDQDPWGFNACSWRAKNALEFWEYLLHVSTFATTRVALPTGVEPG
jgi:hypothetical protein